MARLAAPGREMEADMPGWERRPFLIACVLAVTALAAACSRGPSRPPRHVLIVVVDTLRADRCTINGYRRPTTPGMERLAKESVVYEDAWAPAPWTGPSHASLFTGLRPEQHGFLRTLNSFLPADAETLAEILSADGFDTVCVSTNPNVGPVRNLDQGFERYVPAYRYLTTEQFGGAATLHMGVVDYDPPDSACAKVLEAMRASDAAGRRSFTFLNLFDPHLTYDPPPEDSALLVRPARAEVERWARQVQFPICAEPVIGVRRFSDEEWGVLSDLYDGEVHKSDGAVDRMVAGLREAGLLDSTLLVVTSDHGEMLGEDGLSDHAFHMRPQLLRIPLLVRWPDGRDAGSRVSDLVRLEDVFPTVLEALGRRVPRGLAGESLLGDTAGRISFAATDPGSETLTVLSEMYPGYPLDRVRRSYRSVADGRYHYLRDDVGREWLWDLREDPTASVNRASDLRAEADRLHALLGTVHAGW